MLLRGPPHSPLLLPPTQYLLVGTSRMQCTKWADFIVVDWLKKHIPPKNLFLSVSIEHAPTGWKPLKLQKTLKQAHSFHQHKGIIFTFLNKNHGRNWLQHSCQSPCPKMLTDRLIYLSSARTQITPDDWLTHGHAEESNFEQRKKNKCLYPRRADLTVLSPYTQIYGATAD